MNNVLFYSVQVLLYIHLFHWIYKHYLYELALLQGARLYLILSALAAVSLPFVQFHFWPFSDQEAVFWGFVPGNTEEVLSMHQVLIERDQFEPKAWVSVLEKIYLSGIGIFTLKLAYHIWGIFRNPQNRRGVAWSFFDKIYLSPQVEDLPESEKAQVLMHEQTHALQWHSFDVVLYELLTILLWFNPFMPRLKANLVELHEYLADRRVTTQYDKAAYSRLILKLSGERTQVVSSDFATQLISKRVHMIHLRPQVGLKTARFFLAIPLAVGLVFLFSFLKSRLSDESKGSAFNNSNYQFPVQGQFEIVKPFISSTTVYSQGFEMRLSHKSLAIMPLENQALVAPADAVVEALQVDESGLRLRISLGLENGLQMQFSGIESVNLRLGQRIKKAEVIALLRPQIQANVIEFTLLKEKKAIDPMILFQ